MLKTGNDNTGRIRLALAFAFVVTPFIFGCVATVPKTARIQNADLPDYKVDSRKVEEAIDLYIEPRIRGLRLSVKPRSDSELYHPIAVVVGPALETALLEVTRQHFSTITTIPAPENKPTLSYKLLTYKPDVFVVPGILSTRLNVSARLALQVSVHSAKGEELFSMTAIGTSHVSDTKISTGNGLKDGSRLLEVATRDAIIDTMYDLSSIFGNSGNLIGDAVRLSETDSRATVETLDEVVLHLRTWREDESSE